MIPAISQLVKDCIDCATTPEESEKHFYQVIRHVVIHRLRPLL